MPIPVLMSDETGQAVPVAATAGSNSPQPQVTSPPQATPYLLTPDPGLSTAVESTIPITSQPPDSSTTLEAAPRFADLGQSLDQNAPATTDLEGERSYATPDSPQAPESPQGPTKRPSWRLYASMAALFILTTGFLVMALSLSKPKTENIQLANQTAKLLSVNAGQTLGIEGNIKVSQLSTVQDLVVNGIANLNQGLKVTGSGTFSGPVSATYFIGDGSKLTNLPIPNVPTNVVLLSPGSAQQGNIAVSGTLQAGSLQGNGAAITALDASNLSSGTVADGRLSSNVALLGGSNTFSGNNSFANVITQNGNIVCDISNNCGFVGGGGNSFVQGGNSFGAVANLGTNDNFTLNLRTNGVTRFTLDTSGNSNLTGTATAAAFSGDGSALTGLNATNLASGTVADGRLSTNVTLQGNSFNGVSQLVQLNVSGQLPVLSGVNLTNLNASNLASGTVADALLSNNVPLKNGANTFSALNNFTGGLQASGNTVCDTSGNCAGVGGGVTTLGGTTRTIALFSGNQTIGDSILSQNIAGDLLTVAGGLTLNNGFNLTLGTSGVISANTLQHTGNGFDLAVNAGNDNLVLTAGGRVFEFPTSGPGSQIICTTGITCASGGGQAVILQPGSAQLDNGAGPSIFVDNSGGGPLAELQSGGSDVFTVANDGSTTVYGTLSVDSISSISGALAVGGTAQSTTLQGTVVSVVSHDSGFTTTLGFNGVAANNVTYNFDRTAAAGTYTVCTTIGNCAGAGAGVTTVGGTTGAIAKFSGAQAIADSSLSESGSTVTASGTLVVQGSNALTLGTASGNTGAILLKNGTNANTVTLKSGVSGSNFSLTLPTTGGSNGDCLQSTGGGVLAFNACTGGAGGGVTSIDNQSGVVTLANSSGSGGIVTINNALADGSTKGIATFDSTNFSAPGGVVNTIQGISITATPQFAAVTLTNASSLTLGQASTNTGSILFKGSGSANTITLQGPATPSTNTLTLPNETGTLCSTGSVCTGYAPSTGGSGYVQLQGSTPGSAQTGSFNVTGTGIAGKLLVGYSSNTFGIASFNGHVGIANTNALNSLLYVGSGSGSLTDAAGMGLKVAVDSTASTTPDAAQFNLNVIQGTPAGAAHGLVSRVDVNDASANSGDTVGLWGDTIVHSASPRNTWGLETFVQVDNGSGYTGTAVGAEIGIANLNTGSVNAGGALHVASTNSTEYTRFGIKITSDKFKNSILIPDGASAPAENAFYYGPLAANNVPTGTPEAILTAGGKLGLGVASPDAYLHVTSSAAATKAVVIQGAASQSADLLRFLDSSNNVIGGFNANARLYLGRANNTTGQIDFFGGGASANSIALKGPSAPGSSLTLTLPNETGTLCSTGSLCSGYAASSGSTNYIQNGTSIQTSANFAIQSAALGSVGAVIKAAASQSADLFELQDSSGNINAKFGSSGAVLTLGRIAASGTVTAGQLKLGDGTTDNFTSTLDTNTLTNSRAIHLPDEAGTICLQSSTNCGFAPTSGSGIYFAQGGNSFTAQAVLGTNDNNSLAFRTNNGNRLVVDTTGNLTFQQASTISTIAGSGAAGADLNINSGAGASGFAGGAISIQPGSAVGTSNGANVSITGGTASGLSTGGNVALTGGSGPLVGGVVTITGGTASGAAFPGNVYINGGSGTASSLGTVLIGTSNGGALGSGAVTIGNASMTGNILLGNSTAGQTINIGHAIVATGNTQTIGIGDQATGTGKDVITIGNTNGASSLALNAGTGGFSVTSSNFNVSSGALSTKSDSATALLLQSTGSANNLLFDASTGHLKVFDNSGHTNYADIYYSGSTAVFAANTGTTQVGNGTGDVNVTLNNNSEKFNYLHNVTSGGVSTSSDNDFVITRQLVANSGSALTGNIAKIEDLSSNAGAGGLSPTLLYINQNSNTATGNLIVAQTGGSTTKFSVSTAGNTSVAGTFTSTGLITGNAGATITGGTISLNATGSSNTFINNSGGGDSGGGTGTITLGNTGTGGFIKLLTGDTINLTGVTNINASANNATNINTGTSTGAVAIGAANASSAVTLEAGTGATAIQIGNGATAHGIQIGTGGAIQTIVVGSTNSTSSILVQGGTGNVQIQSQGGTLGIGNNAVAQTLNIGNVTGTTAINERVGTGNYSLDGVTNSTYTLGASTTTGTIAIGGTAQTGSITLGSSSGTNSVLIGNGAGATTVSIANANTAGAVNVGAAFTTGTITIGGTAQTGATTIRGGVTNGLTLTTIASAAASSGAVTLQSGDNNLSLATGSGVVTIKSGSSNVSGAVVGDVNVDTGTPTGGAVAGTINIGTGSFSHNVAIGNLQTSSTVSISGGTGASAVSIQASNGGVNLNTANSGAVNIGSGNISSATQTISIGTGTSTTSGGKVVNIATGIPGASTTNTIHIGDGGSTTGTVGITIGSNAVAAHTTLIQGGNGSTAIQLQTATAGTIGIGNNAVANTVNIANANGANNTTVAIGNGVTGGSNTAAITIGSNNAAASTTLIQGGNGATAIQLVPSDAGAIVIGSATQTGAITLGKSTDSQTINIGTGATASGKTLTIHIGDAGGASSTTNITVGSAVAGTLTVQSDAVFNKNITFNGHLISNGSSVTKTDGTAACTTPTITATGNDSAGVISVTTGTGCAGTGTLVTVNFATTYGSAPKVVITPTNAAGAGLKYYAGNNGATSFTLDTDTIPVDATVYTYNYFVIK